MASGRRSSLAEKVEAVVADLKHDGILGCLEHADLGKTILELHKLHDEKGLEVLTEALSEAVEEVIVTDEGDQATLMILSQLLKDVQAALDDGAPLADLAPKLRLGLISALKGYARRGSEEAADLFTAAGLLAMEGGVMDKVAGDPLLRLAVEKALLGLMLRSRKVVLLLQARGAESLTLRALREEVEALKDYKPASGEEADEGAEDEGEDEGADGEEEDEGDDDDDEEGEE